MNKVLLIGRVGRTPETSVFDNGKKVTKFTLATTEYFSKENKETTWHNISVWDNYGEAMGKMIKTGSQISVEGRIQNGQYEKDGVKMYSTAIVVEKIELLDKKSDVDTETTSNVSETPTQTRNRVSEPVQSTPVSSGTSDDDLPF